MNTRNPRSPGITIMKIFHPPLMRWMRKAHGWTGLWGAVLGLVFGISGIWLNHRAVLKLPIPLQQRSQVQLALPDPRPATPDQMGLWLQSSLELPSPPGNVRIDPARGGAGWMQPERWTFNFGGPSTLIQAEYWKGNQSVSVSTTRNGRVGTLVNLHKGVGMSVGWILLIDTLAGSLVFLSLSGTYLWMSAHRKRSLGWIVVGTPLAAIIGLLAMR